MQFKIFVAVSITLLISLAVTAQTIRKPFADIDKEEKVLTLTNGKYEEFFDDDSLQRIGTALININTMKVVKLQLTEDEQRIMDNSAISRFLSVDPLTSSFAMLTPYQYASNNPILNIDLDGLEGIKITDAQKKTITIVVDVLYVLKQTKKIASSNVDEKQIERINKSLNAELNKKSFKDQKTGYDVKFDINFVKMNGMGDVNMELGDNNSVQDPRMFLIMENETDLGTITDADGNEFQVTRDGGSNWRILRLTSSRNGHVIAHELFHNLTHNHKNAPLYLKTQIDPKNQIQGHKEAGGIFLYANAKDGTKQEDINQKNIQDVLKSVPEKRQSKPHE